MSEVQITDSQEIARAVGSGQSLGIAMPEIIGGKTIGGGVWRFFSHSLPEGGVELWNDNRGWKEAWRGLLPPHMHCFGEDVFGNQLVIFADSETVQLWSHEDGELNDLMLDLPSLLECTIVNGLGWIDFYRDESINVAKQFGLPSYCSHLHWRTPLILGGCLSTDNLCAIERMNHLIGHGKLWRKISNLPEDSNAS